MLALINLNAYSMFSFSVVHFQGENNAIHTQLLLILESINLVFIYLFFLPNKPAIGSSHRKHPPVVEVFKR